MATTGISLVSRAADRASGPPVLRLLGTGTASTAAPGECVLAVEFRSADGQSWTAIGGGPTVAAALDYARESCPDGVIWTVARWNDLYGG